MSLRNHFKTDIKVEQQGVEFDLGDAVITLARAGGSNRAYKTAFSKAVRPLRAAIDAETVREDQLLDVMIAPFVDHVILKWQTRRSKAAGGELVDGIEGPDGVDGELVPATKENIAKFLKEVPELYYKLQENASAARFYLQDLEQAAKN